jgi:hypothetical protein
MVRSDRVVVRNHVQDIAFVVEQAASAACDSSSSYGTEQPRRRPARRDARRRSAIRPFHVLSGSASIDFKTTHDLTAARDPRAVPASPEAPAVFLRTGEPESDLAGEEVEVEVEDGGMCEIRMKHTSTGMGTP